MIWTHLWDMHSGGGQKEEFSHCFIEAPAAEAKLIFYNRFGHNPDRVTCTCCGSDYSIDESETLEEATGYQRGCEYRDGKYIEAPSSRAWEHYTPLQDYLKRADVCVIYAHEIAANERLGELPEQGYIWVN